MEKLLNEYIETNEFKTGTAGYIKEDGSFIIVDEYHGEDEELHNKHYPEFSNTHPEEDTCIRLELDYEPNEIQYKKLEEIIDIYLDREEYCKVEIWDGNPCFYEVFSLIENACDDSTWDEKVGNWTGYKLVKMIKNFYSRSLHESLLLEMNRNQLINKSKSSDNYKDTSKGRNRWERRNKSRIDSQVKQYNKIDMNSFFKQDELKVGINVHGETNDYLVLIRYNGVLREIQNQIKLNNNKLEFKCVLIALQRVFNSGDVFVSCSCLHPDTKIKLLDGSTPTVAEMKERFDKGEQLYVYSTDSNGDFKPGIVEKVWITKKESNLIKVTLDNGESIITTLDHPYMLRDGSYKLAEDLVVGQSLMPMYFNYAANGYERVKFNSEEREWHSIYKLVADYFKADEIEETKLRVSPDDNMSYDVAIHHKDFNKRNNNPDNLQVMTAREHWDYHNSLTWENKPESMRENIKKVSRENAIKRNANPTERMVECRKAFIEKGHQLAQFRNHDPECLNKQAELMRKTMKEYYENISEEDKEYLHNIRSENTKKAAERGCYKTEKFHKAALERGKQMHTPEREALVKQGVINYYSNPENKMEHKRKTLETKIYNILKKMLDNSLELTEDNYELIRKSMNGYPTINKRFTDIDEAVSYFQLNHKIVSIEYITLDEPIDVYDIKVKDWENFVVDAGVVLHNCPDWKYRQAYHAGRDGYNSGPVETRASDITNPRDSKGGGCKHVNLVLGNVDWIMKVASVINNYIHYMEEHMQRQYADIIFPAVFGVPYNKAVQLNLFDTGDEMESDEETINLSNKYGAERTRFTSENQPQRHIWKKPQQLVEPDKPKLYLNTDRKRQELDQELGQEESEK